MGQEKQIWQVAARKRRNFDSPEHMWEIALKYFEWIDNNPLWKVEQKKKVDKGIVLTDSKGVQTYVEPDQLMEIPLKRPYTISGFCIFSGIASNYMRLIKLENTEQGYTKNDNVEWMEVVNRIYDVIFTQQYEGAASGQFNPVIVQKGLGLADKIEAKTEVIEVKEVFKIGDQEFEL